MCNGLVSNLNVTKALTPLSAVIDICNSGTRYIYIYIYIYTYFSLILDKKVKKILLYF